MKPWLVSLGVLAAVGCGGDAAQPGAQVIAGGAPVAAGVGGAGASVGAGVAGAGVAGATPVSAGAGGGTPAAAGARAAGSGGTAAAAAGSGGMALAAAGSGGMAGMPATAGSGGAAGGGGMPAPSGNCPAPVLDAKPFGCKFAFGTNDPGGSLAGISELGFVSKWVGYELDKSGTLPRCDGCSWLTMNVASTPLIPVYYAYFIGFFGKANGLPDGNENPNGPNLTTDAAQLIRDHREKLIGIYAMYAKQTAAVWKDKPLVWLLEGDFVQYTAESQKNRLNMAELGALSRDITCAIKSNMPNALVAVNQSTWNADQVTKDFWTALKDSNYDLVWTTGVPNNMGFFEKGTNSGSYNKDTATYKFVHEFTGRKIFVDTSFGLSGMSDSWSGATATDLNARIADGVIAANVTMPASNYVATVKALVPMLQPTCK